MNSIFDDEDELLFSRSRILMPPTMAEVPGLTSVLVPSLPATPGPLPPGLQRRTMYEALQRLYAVRPRSLKGTPYGIQRAARRPLGIYAAAWYLSVGLVLVDPLDRLEGGLID